MSGGHRPSLDQRLERRPFSDILHPDDRSTAELPSRRRLGATIPSGLCRPFLDERQSRTRLLALLLGGEFDLCPVTFSAERRLVASSDAGRPNPRHLVVDR
ncbi:hypothetical protein M6B38_145125 [Iris pallida]|uniref:Uncharacterized protein n=1 Tax=Iris pallida TaxID=29817 RepID=A0AAX6FA25_IRIPA|nr:hypothetical protein M6B38_145125 [Iris pallida]